MKKIINKSVKWEKKLEELLKKYGFLIKHSYKFGGFAIQPDFIVQRDNKISIIELKVSNIITEKTLYQIMYYLQKINADLAYLALPEECIIKERIKNKLLDNNIGLITIKEDKLIFEEPKSKRKLSTQDLINYDLYFETKVVGEKANRAREEIRTMSRKLFLYILMGGLVFYSISNLLEFYLTKPIHFLGLFSICIIIISIIFISHKNRINRNNSK